MADEGAFGKEAEKTEEVKKDEAADVKASVDAAADVGPKPHRSFKE
jgi:hypothetical protein